MPGTDVEMVALEEQPQPNRRNSGGGNGGGGSVAQSHDNMKRATLKPPRILLETMSSRIARILFLLNLAAFICGFAIDLAASLNSFKTAGASLESTPCSSLSDTVGQNMSYLVSSNNTMISSLPAGDWGCSNKLSDSDLLWIGHITNLQNVVAFSLDGLQSNLSLSESCAAFDDSTVAQYTVSTTVYVCERPSGQCAREDWHLSLTSLSDPTPLLSLIDLGRKQASAQFIQKTFQNQPSLVSNGIVRSYLVYLQLSFEPTGTMYFNTDKSTLFHFGVVARKGTAGEDIALQCILCISVIFIFYYGYELFVYRYTEPTPSGASSSSIHRSVSITEESGSLKIVETPLEVASDDGSEVNLRRERLKEVANFLTKYDVTLFLPDQRQWAARPNELLSEQRWVLFYGIIVILLQNPVYSFIYWQSRPSRDLVYIFYIVDAFAQAGLFTIWHLMVVGAKRNLLIEESRETEKDLQASNKMKDDFSLSNKHLVHIKARTPLGYLIFYGPKFLFGCLLFAFKVRHT